MCILKITEKKKREHRLMTLTGSIDTISCLLQISNVNSEGCHTMLLLLLFYFKSSEVWLQYPSATQRVIHNTASCLSPYCCGICKIFIFIFRALTLRSTPPSMWACAFVHMHNTPVVATNFQWCKFQSTQCFYTYKCNRIWFSLSSSASSSRGFVEW